MIIKITKEAIDAAGDLAAGWHDGVIDKIYAKASKSGDSQNVFVECVTAQGKKHTRLFSPKSSSFEADIAGLFTAVTGIVVDADTNIDTDALVGKKVQFECVHEIYNGDMKPSMLKGKFAPFGTAVTW
jgi:hypothetical protein